MARKTTIIRRVEHFVIYRVLHADDTPHRLALGIALGMFVGWTPTVGFQMLLVLLLAPSFRVNPIVGIPIVWVTNPVTIVPIYFSNYWFGHLVLNLFSDRPALSYAQVTERLGQFGGVSHFLSNFHHAQFWHKVIQILAEFGLDLWVGSIIIGLVMAVISYTISYRLIVWYRSARPHLRLRGIHRHRPH